MQLRQENVWPEQIPFDEQSMLRFIESLVRDCRLCWEMTALCQRTARQESSSPKELHTTYVEHSKLNAIILRKDKCDFKHHNAENKTKIDCWCNYNTNSKIILKNVPILNVWVRSMTLSSGCSSRNQVFYLFWDKWPDLLSQSLCGSLLLPETTFSWCGLCSIKAFSCE